VTCILHGDWSADTCGPECARLTTVWNAPRPKLLDLFCKAGGAAMGYHRAGFEVIGVDIEPQPNYPFEFHQADALHFLAEHWREFVAAHASCPCQFYSGMSACRPGLAQEYPDLIAATRGLLDLTGLPYVMENVPRSPLRPDLMLCGAMFGRALYRHRIFESNVFLWQPEHPKHMVRASKAGHWEPGTVISVSGNCGPIALAREVMDIGWTNRRELAESIPPYFTEHIGTQLLAHLNAEAAA
jgi:DNA (cytosine-5)-methyltransferase 1